MVKIDKELTEQLAYFEKENKVLESQRLERRTRQDMALLREIGVCQGIENYSRHLSGKKAGEPPETLLSYFPKDEKGNADFLCFIDESHMTMPQLGGMYNADKSRKQNLVDHGFRLPSARDNRPLQLEEFLDRVGQMVMVSATPSKFEAANQQNIAEQIIRPTGLVDPVITVKPVIEKGNYPGQVFDFIAEAETVIKRGYRVLATTLTKKWPKTSQSFSKTKTYKQCTYTAK